MFDKLQKWIARHRACMDSDMAEKAAYTKWVKEKESAAEAQDGTEELRRCLARIEEHFKKVFARIDARAGEMSDIDPKLIGKYVEPIMQKDCDGNLIVARIKSPALLRRTATGIQVIVTEA